MQEKCVAELLFCVCLKKPNSFLQGLLQNITLDYYFRTKVCVGELRLLETCL